MRLRIFSVLLIVLFVLSSNSAYCDVNLSRSFKIDEGVTLHMPGDWTEISREAIDKMAEIMADNLGTAVPKYNFAFQVEKAALFDYPYMLVLINNSGRISESEFSNLKKVENEIGKAFDSMEQKLDSIIGNVNIGEQVYDETGKRLLSKMKTEVEGVGAVYMLMDLQLTSNGFIQFMLYCQESDYDRYDETFAQVIDSIEITGDARYSKAEEKQEAEKVTDTGTENEAASATDTADVDNTIDATDTATATDTAADTDASIDSVIDTVTETETGTGTGTETDGARNPLNKAGKNSLSPLLIAAVILVIGIVIFVVLRGNGNKHSTANTSKGGYSDWFCPKCRHGNPASTSVCQNCNHSLM